MAPFSLPHLAFLAALTLLTLALCLLVRRLPRGGQMAIFVLVTVLGCGSIFFRYAMGLTLGGKLNWLTMGFELLQVCNFNFILMPLMLIPRNELARQYSLLFSAFCAATTFVSIPARWANLPWHDVSILNFWINHYTAVLLPILMVSAGWTKPRMRYILPVTGCVVAYFIASWLGQLPLLEKGILTVESSLSFIFDPGGIPPMELLYDWIGLPLVYLIPLLPGLMLLFWCIAKPFDKNH